MDLVLFGIQGSGKGTQSQRTSERYNLKLFETGGELRALAGENSDLGHKVKKITEAGKLVPNQIVMEIVENFLGKIPPDQGVIFDGIPRKADQAESFDKLMKKSGRDFIGILIQLSVESAKKRLLKRRICEKCKSVYPSSYENSQCQKCAGKLITRVDDNPQSIENRLQAFMQETMPIIEKYQKQGKILVIDGEQSIEKASEETFRRLDPYFQPGTR